MSQTLTSLLAHLVFSTKNRMPIITAEIEPELFAYIGGILKAYESRLIDAGGTSDHVHLLVSQSKNFALAKLLKELKQGSSLWIKTVDRQFREFQWQEGYAAFSVSQREVPMLRRYIAKQKEHHRKQTFKKELLQFLNEYGIDYDERYLWN